MLALDTPINAEVTSKDWSPHYVLSNRTSTRCMTAHCVIDLTVNGILNLQSRNECPLGSKSGVLVTLAR